MGKISLLLAVRYLRLLSLNDDCPTHVLTYSKFFENISLSRCFTFDSKYDAFSSHFFLFRLMIGQTSVYSSSNLLANLGGREGCLAVRQFHRAFTKKHCMAIYYWSPHKRCLSRQHPVASVRDPLFPILISHSLAVGRCGGQLSFIRTLQPQKLIVAPFGGSRWKSTEDGTSLDVGGI